jgi:hypothetical protein
MPSGQIWGPLSQIDRPIDVDDGTLPRMVTPSPGPIGLQTPPKAAALNIEFDAFIPGALGAPFESYERPRDLKNQVTFDAALKAVPGAWLEEPGTFSAYGTGPVVLCGPITATLVAAAVAWDSKAPSGLPT